MNRKPLPTSESCFICGEENPHGLRARFYAEDEWTVLPVQPDPHLCGYSGVVHGGVVAAMLDECMGWAAARAIGRMCVTAELTVRYLRRTPAGVPLEVRARCERASRLLAFTQAVLVDDKGTVYARASGKFMPLSKEETLQIDDGMRYRGDELRVFDPLRCPHQPPDTEQSPTPTGYDLRKTD
ncbi:MAG TPA: PaaI family thioesterase [Candidatus Hydrogenedentes bacterium]|nr:PaaI family thioesterase [Candidatus Hydrogenedentota bacterium]